MKGKRALIIDDDKIVTDRISNILESKGLETVTSDAPLKALSLIKISKPDIVFLDIMMPDCDGLEVCRLIRESADFHWLPIVIVSGKQYKFDQSRAFELGANLYITKPFLKNDIVEAVELVFQLKNKVKFWGVRGTAPIPGKGSLDFGGNTSCVSLETSDDSIIVLDSGSGIRNLSKALIQGDLRQKKINLFISHAHWDHINYFPFFAPLYDKRYEINIYGPSSQDLGIKEIILGQMESVHFPITSEEFQAKVTYHTLEETSFELDAIKVSSMLLTHPGNCLGYKFELSNKKVCYITDLEIYPKNSPQFNETFYQQLTQFVEDADLLIIDSTYTDKEYLSKVHWGHSSVSQVVHLANDANVKNLSLFHHDPDQSDTDILMKLNSAKLLMDELGGKAECICPKEFSELIV